jgi:hypothetical protein
MRNFILLLSIFTICIVSCKNKQAETALHPRITVCDGLDTASFVDVAKVYMPSAFTSNSDGKNDNIKPTVSNVSSFTFTVNDINNVEVFRSTQAGQGWTAPAISSNTFVLYYYRIQAISTSGRRIEKCGEVYNLTCYPSAIPRVSLYFEDQLRANGFTGTTTENLQTCQ